MQQKLEIIKEAIRVFSKPSSDPRPEFRKAEDLRNQALVKDLKAQLEKLDKTGTTESRRPGP